MLKYVVLGAILTFLIFGFLKIRAIELEKMCLTYQVVGMYSDKCEGFNTNQKKRYNGGDKRRVIA